MIVEGKTFFHSETGTEGGHWAVLAGDATHGIRDLVDGRCPWGESQGLCPVENETWHQHSRHDGIHVLLDGDELTIRHPDTGEEMWSGVVELIRHPPFTEDALGLWIHADQAGFPREEWAKIFMMEWPCRLERAGD